MLNQTDLKIKGHNLTPYDRMGLEFNLSIKNAKLSKYFTVDKIAHQTNKKNDISGD